MTLPEQHVLTLPYYATNYDGIAPNGLLFPHRHSLWLSTPGQQGQTTEDWFVVRGRKGMLIPRFTTQDSVLREVGVFQIGATTTKLKPPVREWELDVTIRGNDRLKYLEARRRLGHILGWDIATSRSYTDLNLFSTAFDVPNPWTYTFISSDQVAYHIDFAAARFAGDALDVDSPSNTYLETEIQFTSDDPRFYSEEIVNPDYGGIVTNANILTDYPLIGPFLITNVFYTGTARTCYRLSVNFGNTTTVYSIGLFNLTDFTFARFKYVGFPASGWVLVGPPIPPYNLTFDSCSEQLLFTDSLGGVTVLSNSASTDSDWAMFQLLPGKTYAFFIEATPVFTQERILTYKNRYSGI